MPRAATATAPEPRRAFSSLGAVLVAAALIFFATLFFYAREQTVTVLAVAFIDGGAALLWLVAAAGFGTVLIAPLRLDARGLLRFVTSAGLGAGAFGLIVMALALIGHANRVSLAVLVGIGFVCGFLELRRTFVEVSLRSALSRRASALWLLLAPMLAIAVCGAALSPGILWKPLDPHPYDVLSYHLQVPREWFEAGRMQPLLHNVFSFFPFNAEMHILAAMHLRGGAWAGVYTAQFISLGMAVLTVLTLATVSRLAAVVAGVLPWLVMLSCVAYVESTLIFFAALAVVWALRGMGSANRKDAWRCLLICGVFSGIAAGTKITAVPMLLLALPVSVGAMRRDLLPACGGAVLAGLLVLSPWLVRDQIWSGNAVFPLASHALGQAHFTDTQVERFNTAHSPTPEQRPLLARLGRFASDVLWHWQFGFALWPLAVIGAVLRWRDAETRALVIFLAIMALIWLGATHLIGRFYIMAIPAAALLIGRVKQRDFNIAAAALCGAMMLAGWSQMHGTFAQAAGFGRAGAFGLENPWALFTDDLARQERDSGGLVVLVGDSQPFVHQIPMSRLRYRTVFDLVSDRVNPSSRDDVLSMWAGQPLRDLPDDTLFYIDPREAARLARTYKDVPDLPSSLPGPRDAPFMLPIRVLR